MKLKVLYIGDVSGRLGRQVLKSAMPALRRKHSPDFVVANIENAAGGHGVTREVYQELSDAGVDLCTAGDHTFGIKDFIYQYTDDVNLLRPENFEAAGLPGSGVEVVDLGSRGRIAFIVLLGRDLFAYTQKVHNPFWMIDEILERDDVKNANAIFVEYHAESSAEKLSFAWYVRKKVEAVVGTHTHVATADNRLLGGEVAYVTDIGQTGPYEASLWVDFDIAIHNFKYPNRLPMQQQKQGKGILNSVLIELSQDSDSQKYSPQKITRVDIEVE